MANMNDKTRLFTAILLLALPSLGQGQSAPAPPSENAASAAAELANEPLDHQMLYYESALEGTERAMEALRERIRWLTEEQTRAEGDDASYLREKRLYLQEQWEDARQHRNYYRQALQALRKSR